MLNRHRRKHLAIVAVAASLLAAGLVVGSANASAVDSHRSTTPAMDHDAMSMPDHR